MVRTAEVARGQGRKEKLEAPKVLVGTLEVGGGTR